MTVVQTALRLALGVAALWFFALIVLGVSVRIMPPKAGDLDGGNTVMAGNATHR